MRRERLFQLTDVLVGQLVSKSNTLRLMSHRFAVDNSYPELLNDALVNRITLDLDVSMQSTRE